MIDFNTINGSILRVYLGFAKIVLRLKNVGFCQNSVVFAENKKALQSLGEP